MHSNFWEIILKNKHEEINRRKRPIRSWELNAIANRIRNHFRVIDLFEKKKNTISSLKIIAEYARTTANQSEEEVSLNLYEPEEWARRMLNAGTDAVSIICENHLFQGKIEDVWSVHDLFATREQSPPIICKDLILHPIQVLEYAEAGASAVILHIEFLEYDSLMPILEACYEASLEIIIEVHSEYDIERAIQLENPLICLTGRDPTTGKINWKTVEQLIKEIPPFFIKLYAGGLKDLETIKFVRAQGVEGVFLGQLTHLDISENELEQLFEKIKN